MDIKKHKELFDFISAKSSYKGFMNYRILVRLLKELNCYDDFLDNLEIKTLEDYNNFDTNADILGLSFWWASSSKGDKFWRIVNIIYISLMISNKESREKSYFDYEFTHYGEFEYLSCIYYFGVEKSDRIFQLLNSVYKNSFFKPMKIQNYFNKNIKIINKMTDLKFKNKEELAEFLKSNGVEI